MKSLVIIFEMSSTILKWPMSFSFKSYTANIFNVKYTVFSCVMFSTIFFTFNCCSKCYGITVNRTIYTSTLYCLWQIQCSVQFFNVSNIHCNSTVYICSDSNRVVLNSVSVKVCASGSSLLCNIARRRSRHFKRTHTVIKINDFDFCPVFLAFIV